MAKIGILSVSDTRPDVHASLLGHIQKCEESIAALVRAAGFEPVTAEVIQSAPAARDAARRMNAEDVDGIVFNIAMFSFPNLTTIAARLSRGPFLAYDVAYAPLPGLVGLQANVGMLRQNGIPCEKLWGDPEDERIGRSIEAFCRAAHAVSRFRGSVFGLIGGRSIGIGTAAANPDLLMRIFGVDVEHIDELELVRRAASVHEEQTDSAFNWLARLTRAVRYDGGKLTESTLREQIRYYLAARDIAREHCLDFAGIKCHCEMSAHYCTQCLSVAMMNDPYDWEGKKESFAFACESDCDGALTMQLFRLLTGKPSFLVDMRYLDRERQLLVLCNCGSFSTWYAARGEAEENLAKVTLFPSIPKYTGTGCHVQFTAAEGPMTFGRFTRTGERYKLTAFVGECVSQPEERLKETAYQWPHIFVRTQAADQVVEHWESNHIHGTPGDRVEELRMFCRFMDIDFEWLR